MSLIPSISFIENSVGFNPVRQTKNRIGVVSTFSRGATTPTFITGDTFFANNYGYDGTRGSLAYQAARDQGAEDFMCVRVLGNSKPAGGNVYFTGKANKPNSLNVKATFIGDVIKLNDFTGSITTAKAAYTGSSSGRYFFKIVANNSFLLTEASYRIVTEAGSSLTLDSDSVGIIYKFVDLADGDVAPTDWTDAKVVGVSLTNSIPLVFPVSIAIANGVSLQIGETGQTTPLNLPVGKEFKVRVNTSSYSLPINEGDIPYQLATTFDSKLSGVDIFNEVKINDEGTGVVFKLDDTNSSIVGAIGNRFYYSFDIPNIDVLKGDVASSVYPASKLQYITAAKVYSSQEAANNEQAVNRIKGSVATSIYGSIKSSLTKVTEYNNAVATTGESATETSTGLGTYAFNSNKYYIVESALEVLNTVTSTTNVLDGVTAANLFPYRKLNTISAAFSYTSQTDAEANNTTGRVDILSGINSAKALNSDYNFDSTKFYRIVWGSSITLSKLSEETYPFQSSKYYRITFNSGITTTPALNVATPMTGGEDGPRQAYRDFFSINGTPLLRLQANYFGDYGNNIKVTLYPDSNNKFRLVISDLNADNYNPRLQAESYTLDFNNLDANGRLNQLNDSIYVNGLFLPKFVDPVGYNVNLVNQSPVRLAPANSTITDAENVAHSNYYGPTKLVDISLEGGYDGPTVTDNDYIKAINSLVNQPVHLLIAPGVTSPAVQQHLVTHCEKSNDKDGLRRAILACTPRLSPNAAKAEVTSINSPRAVKVVGWASYAGQVNASRFSLSADAIYAGKRAATPYFVSVHARSVAGSARNIYEVDTVTNSNSQALQLYTDARLEVLQVDPGTQSFYFTSGRTTSSDPTWIKEYYRGTYDFIRKDLYDLLSYYIGTPHTLRIRSQIKVSVDSYLRSLQTAGEIANYRDVFIDSINNSSALYVTGTLNVAFSIQPIEAIDYIVVSMSRNTSDGLTNAGI